VTTPSANGATGIFDLEDAERAAAAEALPFPFAYKGEHYEVPPPNGWPVAALTALEAGELEESLQTLIGDETYRKLCAAGLTVGGLNLLFTQLGKAAGFPSLPNLPVLPAPSSIPT
jgi:hypothetical protein